MSTTKWENLLIPRLSGATEAMIRAELVRVIDEFCVRSCAWREVFSELDVTAGEQDVTLTATTENAVTIGVLSASLRNIPLRDRSVAFVGDTTTSPIAYTVLPERPVKIRFDAEPEETISGELKVETYLAPVDVTEDLPQLLTDQFFEVIFNGVLHYMLSVDNRPFTNMQAAAFHGTRYLAGINQARVQAKMGHTSRAQNWAFPRFGR